MINLTIPFIISIIFFHRYSTNVDFVSAFASKAALLPMLLILLNHYGMGYLLIL